MNNKRQRRFAVLAGGLVALLGLQTAIAQEEGSAAAQGDASPAVQGESPSAPLGEGSSAALGDDSRSPFSFSVSQTFRYDSNVRSRPDDSVYAKYGANVPKDRSDTLSVTRAGANFDGVMGRQAFHAGLDLSHTIYNKHSDLNNTSGDANLRWDWRLGDRWSGILGYRYGESFVDFGDTYTNVTTAERGRLTRRLGRANASADFWWHPNWATGFGFSDVRSDYRNNDRPREEYNAQEVSLNFTYRPSTGNRIVLSLRAEEGEYPNQDKAPGSMREWERRDARLSGHWQLSGVTQLSGYAGYTQRKYEWASNRDFSGVTGKIAFRWTPTGKAIINLSWRREIGADADAVSNFAVSHGWTLEPTWVITSKVRLGASFEHLKRNYRGDPGLGWTTHPRDAKTTSYGANLSYLPVPSANITLGYRHHKRDTQNFDYLSYKGWATWLSGSLTF
ncbi:MAG: hypothetical protein LBV29_04075 [Azoarcus sp.]|jgi:exopolysaccharide biosynthesis operon protein EpsL|nr:hypothetical protein [Azoarcus sp.]